MDRAEQKSIEWQKAYHPMAIGGDMFSDLIDAYNVNPTFVAGYHQAKKDIISIIELRLSELLGDAQPIPVLRCELQDLIKKIKEENG